MAEANADTYVEKPTLKKQHGDNTKNQKPRQSKIQFGTVTKEITMKSKLQKLQKEIIPPKSGTSKIISQGFSMRKEIPKCRQKPIYHGGQQNIEYKDECICDQYRKRHELQYTIDK